MINYKDTGNPITRVKARHDCAKASKMDSSEANTLKAMLYFFVCTYAILTSNLWTEVGLYNVTKGTVVYYVYTDSEGSINGGVLDAVVIQLRYLAEGTHIGPFIEVYERSVVIPMKKVEWEKVTLTLM